MIEGWWLGVRGEGKGASMEVSIDCHGYCLPLRSEKKKVKRNEKKLFKKSLQN